MHKRGWLRATDNEMLGALAPQSGRDSKKAVRCRLNAKSETGRGRELKPLARRTYVHKGYAIL
jgi:hypothetical protein